MATYILTKKQKEVILEALGEYRDIHFSQSWQKKSDEMKSLKILIDYIESPYNGSWMGEKHTR